MSSVGSEVWAADGAGRSDGFDRHRVLTTGDLATRLGVAVQRVL